MTTKGEEMNITEFLEARIAEDELMARNASPGPWSFSDIESIGGGTIYDPTVAIAHVEWDTEHVDSRIRRTRPREQADATGSHIARHNPARVLAECAAKRVILGTYMAVAANKNVEGSVQWYEEKALRTSVDTLATVYKDHPDYQQEWTLEA